MNRPKWSRYFRDSLLIHAAIFVLLGGVAYRQLQTAGQAPIKVQVVLSGTGKSGGRQGGSGKQAPAVARAAGDTASSAAPAAPVAETESSYEPAESRPESTEQAPVSPVGLQREPERKEDRDSETPAGSSGDAGDNAGSGSTSQGDAGGVGEGSNAASNGNSGDGNGGNGDGDSGAGDLSEPAVLTRYAKLYPRAARNAGEEGSVLVGVTVSAGGSVTEAYLAESSGFDRLDRAAVKSAYNWRFSPAKNAAGNAIESTAMIRVHYSLND